VRNPIAALVPLLAVLLVVTPRPASSQGCGPGPGFWTGAGAGLVQYDVAGGIDGFEYGVDAGLGSRAVRFEVGVRQTSLEHATATPTTVRGALRYGVSGDSGWNFCLVGHGGASRFTADEDEATVAVWGGGIELARASAPSYVRFIPFIEARGLMARSTGTLLGLEVEEEGRSFGVEAGAIFRLDRVQIRASASVDGLAEGLGVTPYPNRAVRVGLLYRF
jgi:hypothetical protein